MITASLLIGVLCSPQVDQMVDLDRLTQPANYSCRQFSSYDRGSHDPDNWFANGDRGHYLRQENDEWVLAEAAGPGAIVRIWSANPGGVLRIELDGKTVLKEDFRSLLSGEIDAFPPPFGAMRSRGGNLYYPFPYARSMKVTCSEGNHYYHVNYRTYSAGSEIETWSPAAKPPLPEMKCVPSGILAAGREKSGPGVVRRLEIDLPEDPVALRSETLKIFVDGRLHVWSPLGDFFGTAPGRNLHDTLAIGITEAGVGYCNFPMPFSKSFRVETDREVRLWTTDDERPLRFFAWWRGSNNLATHPRSDWPVLNVRGEGRLVGCSLTVRNPVKAWWGEGDEKIYVDGESFPGTFGTGTEDYFGYAWCDTGLFQAPYHSQSRCEGPGNRGHSAVARYHILDDIPFTQSLRFDMEVWHWVESTMGYSTVAYWYASPDSVHDFTPATDEQRALLPLPAIPSVKGAIEGEFFTVVEKTNGVVHPQDLGFARGFSREEHLWWRDAGPGDVLKLRFQSPVAGNELIVQLTRAIDYGIVKLEVNGRLLSDQIDLFATQVEPSGELQFENVAIRKGDNEMVITIVGSNERAQPKNHMFGIDYVRVSSHL